MSVIKSYSVGNGDMFFIDHNSDNFSIIDCCVGDETRKAILAEVGKLSRGKGITRVISTHPDDDHIRGLEFLDREIGILNFYCVENAATKTDRTDSFDKYCELRDSTKAYHISKGCSRRWMNQDDSERKQSGIDILWPDTSNANFTEALREAADGGSANNISAVVRYSIGSNFRALWMGDLDTEFMESVEDAMALSPVTLLFAPHHGRDSGRIPDSMLKALAPKIIVIGEAPAEHLCYYDGYNTITQNSAGDITFECDGDKVHIFSSKQYYVDFLDDESRTRDDAYYVGTLSLI